MNRRFRWIRYIEEIGVKLVYAPGRENVLADFVSRNIKEKLVWRVIKCGLVEFNNLRYTENDIKTFKRTDDVLRKLIKIKKGNKTVTSIPSVFSNIFITFMLLKTCRINITEQKLVIVPFEIQTEIIK